jgi:hypothetical protein
MLQSDVLTKLVDDGSRVTSKVLATKSTDGSIPSGLMHVDELGYLNPDRLPVADGICPERGENTVIFDSIMPIEKGALVATKQTDGSYSLKDKKPKLSKKQLAAVKRRLNTATIMGNLAKFVIRSPYEQAQEHLIKETRTLLVDFLGQADHDIIMAADANAPVIDLITTPVGDENRAVLYKEDGVTALSVVELHEVFYKRAVALNPKAAALVPTAEL